MFTPVLSCTNYTYEIYNESQNITTGNLTLVEDGIYKFEFNQTEGSYIIMLCDDSTREIYIEGEDNMSSVAIVMFILSITLGLFIFPFVKKNIVEHPITNLILRRSCWVIAIYLTMMNAAIVATIADSAGIAVQNEMFRYMWLAGVAGYLMMGYLVISTLFNTLKLWKVLVTNKRMGEEELY